MILLPTKHIPQSEALIGVGATLIRHLREPMTVSGLWEKVRAEPNIGTFERFVLAADLLFLMGAIKYRDGLLVRSAT
jgi:hypothetical protein